MILGTPQGICEPPKFNVEASINTDCLNCFCFGHTTQCYSSDLQISKVRRICCCKSLEFKIVDVLDKCIERFDVWLLQIDLVGELKMVNLNSSLPIDERYVEYLPTGEYGGFYQVGDGLRLVPPGIYYWSLPGEFLGERVHSRICKSLLKWGSCDVFHFFDLISGRCRWIKIFFSFQLTSYGGTLHYDIYYSLGRDQSKILDQADVIMRVSYTLHNYIELERKIDNDDVQTLFVVVNFRPVV